MSVPDPVVHKPSSAVVSPPMVSPSPRISDTPVSSTPTPCLDSKNLPSPLEEENCTLRERVSELSHRLQCVLDHSIESDTRLLRYTDQIFATQPLRKELGTQCDLLADRRDQSPAMIWDLQPLSMETSTQCDLPAECQDQRCAEDRALVQQLRTTVEVMQAELQFLRAEADVCGRDEGNSASWTIVGKRRLPPIQLAANRYACLSTNSASEKLSDVLQTASFPHKNTKQKQIGNNCFNKNSRQRAGLGTEKSSVPLDLDSGSRPGINVASIQVDSDSHGRGVAELLGRLVHSSTKVSGVCKPGAGLLEVASKTLPLPETCSVLIGGTNDVAAGKQHIIYRHLEHVIRERKTALNSKVIVVTLPWRHDLAYNHHINQVTMLVNFYVEEVCFRHGVDCVDVNRIGRHWFTKQGMHLRLRGKQLLARMIAECLARGGVSSAVSQPPCPGVPRVEQSPGSSSNGTCDDAVILGPCPGSTAPLQAAPTTRKIPFLYQLLGNVMPV